MERENGKSGLTEDSFHFFSLALLDQSIEDDDVFAL